MSVKRREFLAALSAAPLARGFAQGPPSETLNVGVIGFGVQGLTDANAAAGVSCTRLGALNGVPTREEAEALMHRPVARPATA